MSSTKSVMRKSSDDLTLESLQMASVKEAADVARVSRTTIWNWIESGKLESRKIQGRRLIALTELRRFLGFD
jgi:excisionase family DNA binding protein